MKTKLTILLAFAVLSSPVVCQAQFRVGPTLGINLSSIQESRDLKEFREEVNKSPLLRLQLGATAEYALSDQFYLQSGLLVNGAGVRYKAEASGGGIDVEASESALLTYLDIPLTARYQFAEFDDFSLSAWGGFIAGFAVAGRSKSKVTINGESESDSESLSFGSSDDDDLKGIDFRLALGMIAESAEYPVQLKVAINQGLVNLLPIDLDGFAQRNFLFSISASYFFELD